MTSQPAYLPERIVDIPNLSRGSVHDSVVSVPVSRARAVSSVSKPSAFHSWSGRGKAGRNERNESPAGATWKSPKPSASHLSGLTVHSLAQTSITSSNLIPSLGAAEIYPRHRTHDWWLIWGQWIRSYFNKIREHGTLFETFDRFYVNLAVLLRWRLKSSP